jgi:protein TonB
VDVGDVLRDRLREPPGFERMALVSFVAHAVAIALVVLAPAGWFPLQAPPPRTVMTITLDGGNGGPASGGLTAIGGRAVQAEAPPEAKRPEPAREPAAKVPEMTVPLPGKTPLKAAARKPVEQAPDEAKGRIPTTGKEVREGSALAETGARGEGFGLSTSGGVGSGSTLDVADFCCPDYIAQMVEKVRANWNARAEVPGQVLIKYTIQRDGTLTGAEVERSSGYTALDINALRAVVGTRQLTPLPAGYPNPTLGVHLSFDYRR